MPLHTEDNQANPYQQNGLLIEDSLANAPAPSITLRPYQEEAIQACVEALDSGLNRIGVSLPVGSGKTTIFTCLIPAIISRQARYPSITDEDSDAPLIRNKRGKTLIMLDGINLADQAEASVRRILGDDWSVEVAQGHRKASGQADITIATVQSLKTPSTLARFDPTEFSLVIVDEAHHAISASYLKVLHYFNQSIHEPSHTESISEKCKSVKVPIVGFTATFERYDKVALGHVFEDIVFSRDVKYMLDNGWLSHPKPIKVEAFLDLSTVKKGNKDYQIKGLANKVNMQNVNDLVVRSWLEKCSDRRSTLCFCVNLEHVADLTEAFVTAGIDARYVSGKTERNELKSITDAFRRGDFPVLINCEIFTEGTDIPEIDCILLARPTKSKPLLIQMVGRGLRLSPKTNKQDCIVLKLVDILSDWGDLDVEPTLLGQALPEKSGIPSLGSGGQHESATEYQKDTEHSADSYSVTYSEETGDVTSPTTTISPATALYISDNAWVRCSDHRYVLSVLGEGFIVLESSMDNDSGDTAWHISYFINSNGEKLDPKGQLDRIKTVGSVGNIEAAFKSGDETAQEMFTPEIQRHITKYAAWRSRSAAFSAVKYYLDLKGIDTRGKTEQELRNTVIDIQGKPTEIGSLTVGELGNLICEIRYSDSDRKKANQSNSQCRGENMNQVPTSLLSLRDEFNYRPGAEDKDVTRFHT
ncbi:uncharacterized protein IL334_002414 [Kwoniella shivajii]|uniref:Uncharacterized protein n=1 Tax=Kwoniella shivajii TaxID=564305 RepID=A0ABZ1CUN8_9TREE|nr:hypothetical protein IL334_002414 [Kwoniella shivajii]